MEADNRWAERARRIHRRTADRAGKHRFQRDDRTDGNARSDPFFARASRDAKNDEHQDRG